MPEPAEPGAVTGTGIVRGGTTRLERAVNPHFKTFGFFAIVALLPLVDAADEPSAAPAVASEALDVNTAEFARLDALPGVAPHEAQAIVDYRSQHGPFQSVEQIKEVPGVSNRSIENVRLEITAGDAAEPAPAERWTGRP